MRLPLRALRVAVLGLTVLAAAGCDDLFGPDDPRTLKIGAAVSITGALSFEAGELKQGYDVWASWVNDELGGIEIGGDRYLVEMVYYDDQSNATLSAELVEKLILEDEVDFIFGPFGSDAVLTTSVATEAQGVLMIQAAGASETIFARGFQNIFGVLTPGRQYTRSGLERLAQLGARTVVIAHEPTPFSRSVAEGAQAWAAEFGMTVIGIETYTRGAADLTPLLQRAKALAPDVFIAGGYYNDAVTFRRQAVQIGFRPPAMLLTIGPSSPPYVTELRDTANLVLGPTQWESSMTWQDEWFGTAAEYAGQYEAKVGRPPTYQAAQGSAVGLVLQAALEKAGSTDTDAVRSALRSLDIETFYGPVRFDPTGKNVAKPMGLTQVQNGRIVVVAPQEVAVAPLIYGGG